MSSEQLPTKLTVYHGTCYRQDEKHRSSTFQDVGGQDFVVRTDFSCCRNGFYTSTSLNCADHWARTSALSSSDPFVEEFELDLTNLKVYDFGTEPHGDKWELWKRVSIIY